MRLDVYAMPLIATCPNNIFQILELASNSSCSDGTIMSGSRSTLLHKLMRPSQQHCQNVMSFKAQTMCPRQKTCERVCCVEPGVYEISASKNYSCCCCYRLPLCWRFLPFTAGITPRRGASPSPGPPRGATTPTFTPLYSTKHPPSLV